MSTSGSKAPPRKAAQNGSAGNLPNENELAKHRSPEERRGARPIKLRPKRKKNNRTRSKDRPESVAAADRGSPTSSARDQLIIQFRDYCGRVVKHLMIMLNIPREQFDEMESAGLMGLVEAADRFDPDNSTDFKSYAYLRIRGAVIDLIRKNTELSGRGYWMSKALDAAQELREHELEGRSTLSKDRSRLLDSRDGRRLLARTMERGLEGLLVFRLCVKDIIEDAPDELIDYETGETNLEKREVNSMVKELLDELPEKERLVLREFYINDKSFAEIVEDNEDLSKSWVSKLHARGIQLLKDAYARKLQREAA